MIKRFLVRLLFRLLDSAYSVTYEGISREKAERWLYESFGDEGFESYFKYEDLKLLKDALNGQEDRGYWMLIGRRFQLLSMRDEARRAFENRKSKEEKDKVKVENNQQENEDAT